jgi:hypothetical protein
MKLKANTLSLQVLVLLFLITGLLFGNRAQSQTSMVCMNPNNIIYGLTSSGVIYGINVNSGATITVKNSSYAGNATDRANGMGYNYANKKFYYFKRNVGASPVEFVSFEPATNTVSVLSTTTTCTNEVHTGSVNYAGTGYYTVDTDGKLSYFSFATNTWTLITSRIVDQYGADVDAVIRSQNSGDMAMDGWGSIYMVTSSATNWGLYKFSAPLPTTPVASLTVTRIVAPTATTPTGNNFAGIAFSAGGQIYMGTKFDNRLYRLNTNFTLTYIGNFGSGDAGNDLTSCNFPFLVLPVEWKSFDASVQNTNKVNLKWEVMEENSQGYYVQHSMDGKEWNNLVFISSQSGRSGGVQEYSYSYTNTTNGYQYYRICQVGLDGKELFSEVKAVFIKNNNQAISIWPNPASEYVRIVSDAGNNTYTKARIFDLSGRMLMEQQLQSTAVNTVSISKLPAGTYIVKLDNGNGASYNHKISKQ